MDELVTWLRGVLDDLEKLALKARRATNSDAWVDTGSMLLARTGHDAETGLDEYMRDIAEASDYQYDEVLTLTARHDPRSVLARVEAERAIVNLAAYSVAAAAEPGAEDYEIATADQWELVLRHLAHGHRHDGPGYRDEWTPEPHHDWGGPILLG